MDGCAVTRKHHHPSPTSGFMSRAQVSQEFGLSPSYLAHLPLTVLAYYKVGTKVLYERSAVVEFIRSQVPGAIRPAEPRRKAVGRPRKPALVER